ncbi:fasciclin domain-containing protein [Marivirga sp. S37H4]|uniref:Fasciclin domain-containing protein n=1 Tax=Marivirga aurantiaca TaxID=2802615 RepID=A0A934WZS6_9BACT|nr:fasciclin domain-containing protein [Marivirga aurantiaca]MBK6266029.1 fasciclin domain-containing protein [Marivirga aurantiaca]
MKKKNLFLKLSSTLMAVVFLAMSSMVLTSCGDDEGTDPDPEPENSVLEIVAESETHTQLEFFLEEYPDLISVLEGDGPITLFAPNDAAFAKLQTILGVESLETVNPDIIKAVLAFHIHAAAEVRRTEMEQSTSLTTAQGENITFNANGNIATGGSDTDVEFVGEEILATNGVVHVVETILVPPVQVFSMIAVHLGKVSQAVLLGADFSTLAAAIQKADEFAASASQPLLSDILSSESETLTVFAPVNAVFVSAGITLDAYSGQEWYGLIANHILSVEVKGADFVAGASYTTKAQKTITVLTTEAPIDADAGITSGVVLDSNGDSAPNGQIALENAYDSQINGVVHAFAGVLTPPTE